MSPDTDTIEARVIATLGVSLSNGNKDYGIVVDYFVVNTNGDVRYVLVTDKGRKIDALSAFRFLAAYRRKLTNAPAVVYPDGTDFAIRQRLPRSKGSGGSLPFMSGSVNTVAKIGDERISMTSHLSSGDSFPEENRTIDQILSVEQIEEMKKAITEKGENNE